MRAVGYCAKSREARKALSKSREADTKSQKVQIAEREKHLTLPKKSTRCFFT